MIGYILVDAAALIAIRDALVNDDISEAYHVLRMQADPECKEAIATRSHWTQWERIAKHSPTAGTWEYSTATPSDASDAIAGGER